MFKVPTDQQERCEDKSWCSALEVTRILFAPIGGDAPNDFDADVCLKALVRTHQAWHDRFKPAARVARISNERAQKPSVFIKPFRDEGASKEIVNSRTPIVSMHRQETTKRFTASAFSFGSIIACVYSSVDAAATIVETELNEPKTPKSDGEKRRLIIGVRAKPMHWAAAVLTSQPETFLKKTRFPQSCKDMSHMKFEGSSFAPALIVKNSKTLENLAF